MPAVTRKLNASTIDAPSAVSRIAIHVVPTAPTNGRPCRPRRLANGKGARGQQALSHGHEARGVRLAPQGRPAADDAPPRRHPPHGDAAADAGRHGAAAAAAPASRKHRKILDDEGGVDFSYVVGQDECRFRVSLFKQRGRLSLVARRVNNIIPTFEELGLPAAHREAVQLLGRPGHPRRRHRLRQEHDHRLDARLHQRARAAAHPHRRGPDRVHLHRQEGVHQPARDRPGRARTGTRPSRTPCGRTPT